MRSGGGVYDDGACWRLVWYDHEGARRFKRLRKTDCPGIKAAREVRAVIAQRAIEEQLGIALPADRMTVAEYWDKVFRPDQQTELKESTWTKHEERFELHIRRPLGALPLARLSSDTIGAAMRAARNRKSGKRLGEWPVYLCHKTLSRLVHLLALRALAEVAALGRMVDEAA